ncbi:MAG: PepSY domain-containing protein [Novosphingobium sp.]|uniref:PepSY-associated TM helix domain-containing protein n=1 Tax=Novosphingobium sp. TaxID=1874826 RepID=UPI00180AC7A0|nr:PepSY domain-containing protein [Novosphingobium sp.]
MTPAATEAADAPVTHGYRAVWRWHFYAALWTAPLLLVLTLTGAIYLFDREIDGWWNGGIQTVAAGPTALPLARQEAAIEAAFPGAEVVRVRLPRDPAQAAVWNIRNAEGTPVDVFLDPYRARVTGTADPRWQPMTVVRDLHGTLLGGEVGSHVVELVACWTLVMLATGIWLWWPRTWKARGAFVPRLGTTGRRFWRDLHAIPAIFNAVFVILLVLTGLPWSAFWGPQFAKLGEVVPFVAASPNFKAPPKADGGAGSDPHAAHKAMAKADPDTAKIPWTIKHVHAPEGTGRGAIGIAQIEPLLTRLDQARFGGGARIFYPKGPTGVFMISYVPDKAEGQRTLYIDPGSGRVIGNIGWSDYSPTAKVVEWGVMTHMGRQYGLLNQLANLAVCLVLIGSVGAGLTLWWKRRPKGELAAPGLQTGDRMPRGIKILLGALAVLFPLVGATMLPVLAWSAWRGRAG